MSPSPSDLSSDVRLLLGAIAKHAQTLDDAALIGNAFDVVTRDDVDNQLYNAARALDPEWWDQKVPGLNAWIGT